MSPPAATSLLEEPVDQDFDEHVEPPTPSPNSEHGVLEGLFALACPLLLMLAAGLNPLDQSDSTPAGSAGAGLTMEVAMKLLLSGAVGLVAVLGWILCPPVRQRLAKFPGWVLVGLGGVFLVTSSSAFGPAATVSRAAAMISCLYIVFIAVTLQFLSLRQSLQCVLVGLVLHLIVAWCLYLGGGETAVYQEELGQSLIIERMGSTAHPNSLGRIGALAVLVCLGLWRTRTRPLTPVTMAMMGFVFLISSATMFESMSRTAVVSCVASVLAVMADRLVNRRGLALGLFGVMGVCLLMLTVGLLSEGSDVGSRVVAVGTKTGDVNELTSATGRTEIWAEAIRYIAQRPLTGWGLNSAPLLLEDFSHHTHNLLLHALFQQESLPGYVLRC
ncbi:MAG: O-antigen ligase family protein [Rhodopirellula sp. JB055]|uniref:O-antigen ligase family protein n=1 Tax=Rhodopirellula sp. JB055 TaxID=3342846 RepID=UPI00370BE7C0